MRRLVSALAFGLATPALAEVTILGPGMAQVLPDGEIFLRNRSAQALTFHLSQAGGPWEAYSLVGGATALIRAPRVAVAVATTRTDAEAAAASAPDLDPAAVAEGRAPPAGSPFDYLALDGAERGELCWSRAEGRWAAQKIGGGRC